MPRAPRGARSRKRGEPLVPPPAPLSAKSGSGGSALCLSRIVRGSGRIGFVAITREEVLHVAKLARLELSDAEVDRFVEQLSAILEAVGKVSELDLGDVEPTAHPLELVNVWGDDEPRPSLPDEEALANAPEHDAGFFAVPARGA